MASATIHLAIAKKYLESNNSHDYEEFIAGTLYPDATADNNKAHYTAKNRGEDNISRLRGRVNLYKFLMEHPSLSDFELGWYLHLIGDYLFFSECFSKEYLLNNSHADFCKDLYFAYDCLNLYLTEKYQIGKDDYKSYPSQYFPGIPYEECILSKELIDNFINRVATINLEAYTKKIQKAKVNVKP